jgi:hypothetical protein
MEIKVQVPDELAAQAKARGLTVEDYVQQLLAQRRARSSDEVRAWLDSLTQFSDTQDADREVALIETGPEHHD